MMKEYREMTQLTLEINGERRVVAIRPADTLLRVLREKLGLVGTKMGCENGDCGACTLLVDGEPVKSCMLLAVEAERATVTTIEGLRDRPLQDAFVAEAGFQCGFCTAGFILNAHALLNHVPNPTDEELRTWLSSNLCRCTGYEAIERSVKTAVRNAARIRPASDRTQSRR